MIIEIKSWFYIQKRILFRYVNEFTLIQLLYLFLREYLIEKGNDGMTDLSDSLLGG